MARDLMAAKNVFADALEDALEEWDGSGAPEDVLERALSASTDAEHGRRLMRHRKRMRGEPDEPMPEEGGYGEEPGEACEMCGKSSCDCGDLPEME